MNAMAIGIYDRHGLDSKDTSLQSGDELLSRLNITDCRRVQEPQSCASSKLLFAGLCLETSLVGGCLGVNSVETKRLVTDWARTMQPS